MSVFIKTEPLDIHEDDFVGQIIAEAEAFEKLTPVEKIKVEQKIDVALMGKKWCAYENCEMCIDKSALSIYCYSCYRYCVVPALTRENDEKHSLYYSTIDKIEKLNKKKEDLEKTIDELHIQAQIYGHDYHETTNKNRITLMTASKRPLEQYPGYEFHPVAFFKSKK